MTKNKNRTSRRYFLSLAAGSLLASSLPAQQVLPGDEMPPLSTAKSHLKWDVFVTPSIPVVTTDFAPGEHERPWPPISSTLIYGSRDAVVVDSFITVEQARAQADWIASTGKNLTTIYATHGHGDHFFGASVLLERFPNARFVAAPSAIQMMKEQTAPEFVESFWEARFPGKLPKDLVDCEEVAGKTTTARELYDGMLVRYREWLNRGALWSSATAAKK